MLGSLLVSTAWLFAYDFHFASLVAAWVKYRGSSLDLVRFNATIRAWEKDGTEADANRRRLGLAFLYSLPRVMAWEELGGWRRRLRWLSVARTIKTAIGNTPLSAAELIQHRRLTAIKGLVEEMQLRLDLNLTRLGLELPWLGIEEERKILPLSYVQRQVAQTR